MAHTQLFAARELLLSKKKLQPLNFGFRSRWKGWFSPQNFSLNVNRKMIL
jgi:hypothetical protein